jgi:hypothetical protein
MPPGWARRILTFVREKREVGTFGDQSLSAILQRATMAITVSDDLDKALANFIKAAKAPGKIEKKDGELRIGGIRVTPKSTQE